MASASRSDAASRSAVTSPMIRMPSPGPGKGCRQTISARQAQLLADPAHLVLEQRAQRLDQLKPRSAGSPPTLWWDLMLAVPVPPPDSTTSGYSVPCTRNSTASPWPPASAAISRGGPLERADELAADDLALLLRVGHARPARPGTRPAASTTVQADPGRRDEVLLDLLGLALAQQAVVDEHAGQPGRRWPAARARRRPPSPRRRTARRWPGRRPTCAPDRGDLLVR